MFASYHTLNSATSSFKFPIPYFFDSFEDLEDAFERFFFQYFSTFDKLSLGAHVQVLLENGMCLHLRVKKNNLSSFLSSQKMFLYSIPRWWKFFRKNWILFCNATKHIIPTDTTVVVIFCYSKTINDDHFICSYYIPTLLRIFSCATYVFTK